MNMGVILNHLRLLPELSMCCCVTILCWNEHFHNYLSEYRSVLVVLASRRILFLYHIYSYQGVNCPLRPGTVNSIAGTSFANSVARASCSSCPRVSNLRNSLFLEWYLKVQLYGKNS